MISYKKLWILLATMDIDKKHLKDVIGLDQNIYSKLNSDKYVSLQTLERIATNLNVDIDDIVSIKKGPTD